jgi:hypothetical protein
MAIQNNRLTQQQYDENFADIRPPFERPPVPQGGNLDRKFIFEFELFK